MQSVGAFKRGIQNEVFMSKENFRHLQVNINQILSEEYNHPVVVNPDMIIGVMKEFSYNYEPQNTCSLNKRVIAKIRNLMRDDQNSTIIANEWENEQYEVLSRNEDTVYNPIAVPVKIQQNMPLSYIEI